MKSNCPAPAALFDKTGRSGGRSLLGDYESAVDFLFLEFFHPESPHPVIAQDGDQSRTSSPTA